MSFGELVNEIESSNTEYITNDDFEIRGGIGNKLLYGSFRPSDIETKINFSKTTDEILCITSDSYIDFSIIDSIKIYLLIKLLSHVNNSYWERKIESSLEVIRNRY